MYIKQIESVGLDFHIIALFFLFLSYSIRLPLLGNPSLYLSLSASSFRFLARQTAKRCGRRQQIKCICFSGSLHQIRIAQKSAALFIWRANM